MALTPFLAKAIRSVSVDKTIIVSRCHQRSSQSLKEHKCFTTYSTAVVSSPGHPTETHTHTHSALSYVARQLVNEKKKKLGVCSKSWS